MRLLSILTTILILLTMPLALFAGEAAEAADALLTGNWLVDIMAIIATLVGGALSAYTATLISSKRDEIKERLKTADLNNHEQIRYEAALIMYDVVGNINKQYLPTLVKAVQKKQITSVDDLKAKLRGLGDLALEQVVSIGAQRGIDLVEELGKDWLVSKIRSIVDQRSPFMGDTAESLLNGGASWLIRQGREWAGSRGIELEDKDALVVVPEGHDDNKPNKVLVEG